MKGSGVISGSSSLLVQLGRAEGDHGALFQRFADDVRVIDQLGRRPISPALARTTDRWRLETPTPFGSQQPIRPFRRAVDIV